MRKFLLCFIMPEMCRDFTVGTFAAMTPLMELEQERVTQKCPQTLEPPQYVFWYHNEKIINYDTKRTRVSFDLG